MKVIEPQPISLLSSSVPEDDAPAWNMETAYQVGEPVVYAHKVYKAVSADNNVGKQPDQHCDGTAAFWRLVGPTNRYAMLDQYVSTQTAVPTDAGALSFTVTFNRCTAFALLAFKAATIRTVVRDGDGIILHDKTVTTLKDVDDYWQYYFRKLEYIEDLIVADIPVSPVATLEVTMHGGTALGHVVVGQAWSLGMTQYNTRIGIRDYSRKETDEFGNTRLVKRANAKRTSLPLYLPPSRIDTVREILARLHGVPALWVGHDEECGYGSRSLTIWGWIEDWSASFAGPNQISMTIDIQGLK